MGQESFKRIYEHERWKISCIWRLNANLYLHVVEFPLVLGLPALMLWIPTYDVVWLRQRFFLLMKFDYLLELLNFNFSLHIVAKAIFSAGILLPRRFFFVFLVHLGFYGFVNKNYFAFGSILNESDLYFE